MLKITKTAPDRVDIALEDTLDSDGMRAGLDDLLRLSEGMTAGKMLYTIRDFSFPSLGALAVELSYMPQLLRMIGRFDKCAVCTDSGWIGKAAEVEGALIPGLEIEAFGLDEVEKAEAWLAD